jgi:hypothetical protein
MHTDEISKVRLLRDYELQAISINLKARSTPKTSSTRICLHAVKIGVNIKLYGRNINTFTYTKMNKIYVKSPSWGSRYGYHMGGGGI